MVVSDAGDKSEIVVAVVAVLTMVGAFLAWIFGFGGRIGRLEAAVEAVKRDVTTIWQYAFDRGVVSTLKRGWAMENSPMELTKLAIEAMAPIAPILKTWYATAGFQKLTNEELALEIQRQFREKIRDEVCKPHGLDDGTCLIAAVLVCRHDIAV